jgi:hypothetical protein
MGGIRSLKKMWALLALASAGIRFISRHMKKKGKKRKKGAERP